MEFGCINGECLRTHHFSDQEPESWSSFERYARQGLYRHKCPWCGAAMTPISFRPPRDGKRIIGYADYYAFSECPNACRCFELGNYTPDCEMQVLQPKCLDRLYALLEGAETHLQCIEQLAEETRLDRLSPKQQPGGGKVLVLHKSTEQNGSSHPEKPGDS